MCGIFYDFSISFKSLPALPIFSTVTQPISLKYNCWQITKLHFFIRCNLTGSDGTVAGSLYLPKQSWIRPENPRNLTPFMGQNRKCPGERFLGKIPGKIPGLFLGDNQASVDRFRGQWTTTRINFFYSYWHLRLTPVSSAGLILKLSTSV